MALATKKRVKRKKWTKVRLKKRYFYVHFNLLNKITNTKEEEDNENYCRMKNTCFNELLSHT